MVVFGVLGTTTPAPGNGIAAAVVAAVAGVVELVDDANTQFVDNMSERVVAASCVAAAAVASRVVEQRIGPVARERLRLELSSEPKIILCTIKI